ncbi:hypothetical protein ACOMHN_009268 [Nucella lapillus]
MKRSTPFNNSNNNSSSSVTATVTATTPGPAPDPWSMMQTYNLSMADLLQSMGFASNGRWFSPHLELCLVLLFSLAISLGLLGNCLVAVVLCRRANLRSPRHWYLLNLVVSDILTCVFCVPFTLLRLTLKHWWLGEGLCQVAPFLQLTYVLVSIFTILAIAVERYRSIVCSSSRLDTSSSHRVARAVIPAIWAMAMVLALPLAVTHRLEHVHNVTGEVIMTLCIEHWGSDTLLGLYTVLILLCQYAVPAAAITTLHFLICRFLRTRVHLRISLKKNRHKLARHRKNLLLLTVISVTFALQWLPITVINILADFDVGVFSSAADFSLTYALCLFFALASVFVNPVVYGCFNSNIRRDILAVCNIAGHTETSESATRPGSSEATSRFYTTMLGSLTTGNKQSSVDSGILTGASTVNGLLSASKQRLSVDAVFHVSPSREVLQRLEKQRTSLQLELG